MAFAAASDRPAFFVSKSSRPCYVMEVVRFSDRHAARILGLSPRRLRALARAGALRPASRGYDFLDLRCLRVVGELRARGVPLRRIRDTVERLRSQFPELERPAASLRLAEPRPRRLLVRIRGALQEPGGQMLLDFEPDCGARVCALPEESLRPPEAAAAWFELGCRLEGRPGEEEAARGCYRRAVEADPGLADAWCNLGAVEHRLGRRAEAERAWREAIRRAPRHVEARLNLAALLEDAGRPLPALHELRAALRADPLRSEAHLHAALLCERLGFRSLARGHWRRYLALDPDGGFASIARSRLEGEGR